MSDESNEGGNPPVPTKAERLSRLIARANANGAASVPSAPRDSKAHASVRVSTATGEVTVLDTNGVDPNAEEERVDDSGIALQAEVDAAYNEYLRIKGRLDAHTFDPRTGAKVYALTGEERRKWELMLATAKETVEYQVERGNRIAAQRDRDRAALAAEQQAAVEREERLNERAVELADEAEARRRADAILTARRNRGY